MAYVWKDGCWRDKRTNEPMSLPEATAIVAPAVVSDLPAYRSPLGTGWIDGRRARREDLKRSGCREVDPSEFRPAYHNKKFAEKRGKEWTPAPPPKPRDINITPVIRD